jgi:hypothetical protein
LVAASLLLFIVVVAIIAALGPYPGIGLALPLQRLGDWGVPGATLHSLGVLVRQAKERRNILDVVGGEFLQHLLIPYVVAGEEKVEGPQACGLLCAH